MGETILAWVSTNGIIICAIAGIICIAWNFVKYIKGGSSIKDILISAVILLIVIGLIVAATNYSAFQASMGDVATSGLTGVGNELNSALGS
jgi:uncharacterized membrane protein YidH (DUF202 family)